MENEVKDELKREAGRSGKIIKTVLVWTIVGFALSAAVYVSWHYYSKNKAKSVAVQPPVQVMEKPVEPVKKMKTKSTVLSEKTVYNRLEKIANDQIAESEEKESTDEEAIEAEKLELAKSERQKVLDRQLSVINDLVK